MDAKQGQKTKIYAKTLEHFVIFYKYHKGEILDRRYGGDQRHHNSTKINQVEVSLTYS